MRPPRKSQKQTASSIRTSSNTPTRYTTVTEELKKNPPCRPTCYLSILEDTDFGLTDVSSNDMLAHLKATYGIITNEEIESNRAQLTSDWNLDDPIEDLWLGIQEVQRFAATTNKPITDTAALHIAELDVPCLPPAASHVHIMPALEAQSLISMGHSSAMPDALSHSTPPPSQSTTTATQY
jgi:hypothetical protein